MRPSGMLQMSMAGVLFLLHGQLQAQELLVSTLLSHEFLGERRGTGKKH